MTIYQVVQLRDNIQIHVIAAYTKLEEAVKELEWRIKTHGPLMYDNRIYHSGVEISKRPYLYGPRDDYRILETELITDKFTEFALKGAMNDSNTNI